MRLGAHVSAEGGLGAALERAEEMGAEAAQVFSRSPRAWRGAEPSDEALVSLREDRAAGLVPDLPLWIHASYLINLGSADPSLLERSVAALKEHLRVATLAGAAGVVLHLGSDGGAGFDAVLGRVATALGRALEALQPGEPPRPGGPVLALENAAGAGHALGASLEQLARVLDACKGDERLRICLDTQHLFAAGIDFTTPERADALLASVHRLLGMDRLACLHLNDSAVPLGARRDRHANLGEGEIGEEGLAALLGHPDLAGLDAILEVPGAARRGPGDSDLERARRILALGVKLRRGAAAPRAPRRAPDPPTPQRPRAPRRGRGGRT